MCSLQLHLPAAIDAVMGNEIIIVIFNMYWEALLLLSLIQNVKKKRKVRKEIINTTLDHLVECYGGVDTPRMMYKMYVDFMFQSY